MTPEALAALHARAFTVQRPWSAVEFARLLQGPGVILLAEPGGFTHPHATGHSNRWRSRWQTPVGYLGKDERGGGFLLARGMLDEAEILTLAVDPVAQRRGIGRRLVDRFLIAAAVLGAVRAILEVAADNAPAGTLYAKAGFREVGRRRGYFARDGGPAVDAIVMVRDLPDS